MERDATTLDDEPIRPARTTDHEQPAARPRADGRRHAPRGTEAMPGIPEEDEPDIAG